MYPRDGGGSFTWCHYKLIDRDINELLLYHFFKKSGLPEHHALYGA